MRGGGDMKEILLIPRIRIQNANALSSPYTIGFPAMTAWLGGVHALQRHLTSTEFSDIRFNSVGVVCHTIDLQTHRGDGDYVHSIIGTGNPLIPKTQKGDPQNAERPPFVEEARCHLSVSLIIEIEGLDLEIDEFTEIVDGLLLSKMKLAGGDILSALPAKVIPVNSEKERRALMRSVMPGYCLIERLDLMKQSMEEGQDAIDSLLDHLKVTHSSSIDATGKVQWQSSRKNKGWIVPIAIGFHGISKLGQVKNQRDSETPHRFAESVVTLGEFVMPYRIENLDHMLWEYHHDPDNNLYLCRQKQPINEI